MQKTLVIGYLGKDPELKYTGGGTAVATFSVAATDKWKDREGTVQEHTEWFNVKAFGRRAETAGEHLHKGSRIYIEGHSRTESWDDKKSGERKFMHFLCVDRFEFLSNGNRNGNDTPPDAEAAITDDEPF